MHTLNQRHVQAFIKAVDAKVLPSLALKRYFQINPFSPALNDEDEFPIMGCSFSHHLFFHVTIPLLKGETTLDKDFMRSILDNPSRLWNHHLGAILHKAHLNWREAYIGRVRELADGLFDSDGDSQADRRLAQALFLATELDSPTPPASYRYIHPIFAGLFVSKVRALMKRGEGQEGGNANGVEEEEETEEVLLDEADAEVLALYLHQNLHGRYVRDIFPVEEEAFILMVIRKHLGHKFGMGVLIRHEEDVLSALEDEESSAVIQLVDERPSHGDNSGETGRVQNEDPGAEIRRDDIFPNNDIIHFQDVRYFCLTKKMLHAQDRLRNDSMHARRYCDFSFPVNPDDDNNWSDDSYHGSSGSNASGRGSGSSGSSKRIRLSPIHLNDDVEGLRMT